MLKRGRRWLLVVVAVVLAAVAIKVWRALDQPSTPAPKLVGTAVDGRTLDLAQSLKAAGDKPVMVVFWATWCPECLAEQDNIQSISRDYEVVAVAWRSEGNDAVTRHMTDNKLTYPTLSDESGTLAKAWGVIGVPTHYIVEPNGMTRFRVEGSRSEWKLRARLWWTSKFPT